MSNGYWPYLLFMTWSFIYSYDLHQFTVNNLKIILFLWIKIKFKPKAVYALFRTSEKLKKNCVSGIFDTHTPIYEQ